MKKIMCSMMILSSTASLHAMQPSELVHTVWCAASRVYSSARDRVSGQMGYQPVSARERLLVPVSLEQQLVRDAYKYFKREVPASCGISLTTLFCSTGEQQLNQDDLLTLLKANRDEPIAAMRPGNRSNLQIAVAEKNVIALLTRNFAGAFQYDIAELPDNEDVRELVFSPQGNHLACLTKAGTVFEARSIPFEKEQSVWSTNRLQESAWKKVSADASIVSIAYTEHSQLQL